jgi:phosphatidylglycerol---prolipoprotein diacylglyceryl transferase
MSEIQEIKFKPKKLAYILSGIFVLFWVLSFGFFKQIFNGTWIVQQNIDIINIDSITIPAISFLNTTKIEIPIGIASVRYYSLCISAGVMLGYFLSIYLAKLNLVVSTVIDRLFIGIIFTGFLGARIFFVAFNWSTFWNPDSIQNSLFDIILGVNQGGLAFFGGFLGSLLYLIFYTHKYHFNIYEFLDFLIPGLLLGQIIGRFGNFFNYEAYGNHTKVYWRMFVPPSARLTNSLELEYYHPTFLYEIIPNMLLLIFLLFKYENLTKKNSGLILAWYATGYGLIRFFSEFFRTDALYLKIPQFHFWLFTFDKILISQLSALILFITGLILLSKRKKILYLKKEMTEIKYT